MPIEQREGHTPGPWFAIQSGKPEMRNVTTYIIAGDRDDGVLVADVNTGPTDARLIAAAPEMYEALKALDAIFDLQPEEAADIADKLDINDHNHLREVCELVRDVLAKPSPNPPRSDGGEGCPSVAESGGSPPAAAKSDGPSPAGDGARVRVVGAAWEDETEDQPRRFVLSCVFVGDVPKWPLSTIWGDEVLLLSRTGEQFKVSSAPDDQSASAGSDAAQVAGESSREAPLHPLTEETSHGE